MLSLAGSYTVVDSHTAGHPTRVILSGIPPLPGATVRVKRDAFRKEHDLLRSCLLHEPRGHAAMVGLVPVASSQADFGAFFISSYIYLDMCGHATIGYAKTLAATGTIAAPLPEFTLETPAGIVTVWLDWNAEGGLRSVRFINVPCRVGLEAVTIEVDGIGHVSVDIVYGGLWYAIVDARAAGLTLSPDTVSVAMTRGAAVKDALATRLHGMPEELGGGSRPSVLFYEKLGPLRGRHLLVLESNKFDRSPCGTGTSAMLALLALRGQITEQDTYVAENILGAAFRARIVRRLTEKPGEAIVPEIMGNAHITAFSTIVKEADDPLSGGFLCR